MKLEVKRTQFGDEATNGELWIDGVWECYTLEDEVRDGPKVYGETAIPAGEYEIKLRTVGGFHSRTEKYYDDKEGFGEGWHQGMLCLRVSFMGFSSVVELHFFVFLLHRLHGRHVLTVVRSHAFLQNVIHCA